MQHFEFSTFFFLSFANNTLATQFKTHLTYMTNDTRWNCSGRRRFSTKLPNQISNRGERIEWAQATPIKGQQHTSLLSNIRVNDNAIWFHFRPGFLSF